MRQFVLTLLLCLCTLTLSAQLPLVRQRPAAPPAQKPAAAAKKPAPTAKKPEPTAQEAAPAEAVRLAKSLPKFIPAKQQGKAVNSWFTLPIRFQLQ